MRFQVLGPVQLEAVRGARRIPSTRRRTLLAALVLHAGRAVPTEQLIDLVWGARPPRTARASLHSHLSRLRGLLREVGAADALETDGDGYRLDAGPAEVDAHRFEAAVRESRSALAADPRRALRLLDRAAALWRGPAYADVPQHLAFEAEAVRLGELWLSADDARAQARLALGRDDEVAAQEEAAIAARPLHEPAYAALMLALYRSGRRAEALDVYATCRTVLTEQLGVEPSPPLRRLHHDILALAVPPAPGATSRRRGDGASPRGARRLRRIRRAVALSEADAPTALRDLRAIASGAHRSGDATTEGAAVLAEAYVCVCCGAPSSAEGGPTERGAVRAAIAALSPGRD